VSNPNSRLDRVFVADGRPLILAFDLGAGGLSYAGWVYQRSPAR
jgi:hypothetical protein